MQPFPYQVQLIYSDQDRRWDEDMRPDDEDGGDRGGDTRGVDDDTITDKARLVRLESSHWEEIAP